MNAKELYRFLETLATVVEHQASAIENHAHGQSLSSKGSSFDDFKKLGFPYFFGTSNLTKTKTWILKIEKFFDVMDCFEELKTSYVTFMLEKEVDHWWHTQEAFKGLVIYSLETIF